MISRLTITAGNYRETSGRTQFGLRTQETDGEHTADGEGGVRGGEGREGRLRGSTP